MSRIEPSPPAPGERCNAHVVLVAPRIGGNAGSLARVCAATRSVLHLVEPLGFELDDRHLRRAGLDYWPAVRWQRHPDLAHALAGAPPDAVYCFSAEGGRGYHEVPYPAAPWLVFGQEDVGLPAAVREAWRERLLRLPQSDAVRSLNLANAATAVLYEALRQQGFPGLR